MTNGIPIALPRRSDSDSTQRDPSRAQNNSQRQLPAFCVQNGTPHPTQFGTEVRIFW